MYIRRQLIMFLCNTTLLQKYYVYFFTLSIILHNLNGFCTYYNIFMWNWGTKQSTLSLK